MGREGEHAVLPADPAVKIQPHGIGQLSALLQVGGQGQGIAALAGVDADSGEFIRSSVAPPAASSLPSHDPGN